MHEPRLHVRKWSSPNVRCRGLGMVYGEVGRSGGSVSSDLSAQPGQGHAVGLWGRTDSPRVPGPAFPANACTCGRLWGMGCASPLSGLRLSGVALVAKCL